MPRHCHLDHLLHAEGRRARRAWSAESAIHRLSGDKRGAATVVLAGAMTSVLGATALAVGFGNSYLVRRNMQTAADAAAMAGAIHYEHEKDYGKARAAAISVATRNGFTDAVAGAKVTVLAQAVARPGGVRPEVRVRVERDETSRLFAAAARLAGSGASGTRTVSASAVATMVDAGAPPCVHTLTGSLSVGNNGDVTANDCALASNAPGADAVVVGSNGGGQGQCRVTTANTVAHGGCMGCATAMQGGDAAKLKLTQSPAPTTYTYKVQNRYDDLDNWQPPNDKLKNCASQPNNVNAPLLPGCYTSISVKNNGPVDLTPGVYYVTGNLDVQGRLTCSVCDATKEAAGVSIVLIDGQLKVTGQGSIELNASRQLSEPRLDGVVLYRYDRDGRPDPKGDVDFQGGGTLKVNGAIVAPQSHVAWGGNSSSGTDDKNKSGGQSGTNGPDCTVFVTASMEFKGNTSLSVAGCSKYGTETSATRIVRLVE